MPEPEQQLSGLAPSVDAAVALDGLRAARRRRTLVRSSAVIAAVIVVVGAFAVWPSGDGVVDTADVGPAPLTEEGASGSSDDVLETVSDCELTQSGSVEVNDVGGLVAVGVEFRNLSVTACEFETVTVAGELSDGSPVVVEKAALEGYPELALPALVAPGDGTTVWIHNRPFPCPAGDPGLRILSVRIGQSVFNPIPTGADPWPTCGVAFTVTSGVSGLAAPLALPDDCELEVQGGRVETITVIRNVGDVTCTVEQVLVEQVDPEREELRLRALVERAATGRLVEIGSGESISIRLHPDGFDCGPVLLGIEIRIGELVVRSASDQFFCADEYSIIEGELVGLGDLTGTTQVALRDADDVPAGTLDAAADGFDVARFWNTLGFEPATVSLDVPEGSALVGITRLAGPCPSGLLGFARTAGHVYTPVFEERIDGDCAEPERAVTHVVQMDRSLVGDAFVVRLPADAPHHEEVQLEVVVNGAAPICVLENSLGRSGTVRWSGVDAVGVEFVNVGQEPCHFFGVEMTAAGEAGTIAVPRAAFSEGATLSVPHILDIGDGFTVVLFHASSPEFCNAVPLDSVEFRIGDLVVDMIPGVDPGPWPSCEVVYDLVDEFVVVGGSPRIEPGPFEFQICRLSLPPQCDDPLIRLN